MKTNKLITLLKKDAKWQIGYYNSPENEYAQPLDEYLDDDNIDWEKESRIDLINPNDAYPSEWNKLTEKTDKKVLLMAKTNLGKIPPVLVVEEGKNKYKTIDGIHRVFAAQIAGYKIPAIIATKKLEENIGSDSQMYSFVLTKYKDYEIPESVKLETKYWEAGGFVKCEHCGGGQSNAIIKAKLSERTTEQLIQDAKVARGNRQDETNRMISALAMDIISTRVSGEEFEKLYEQIYG